MKDLMLVGNGGFSREVRWIIERINQISPTWNIIGVVDANTQPAEVIGDEYFLTDYNSELDVGIAIGNSFARRKLYELYKDNPYLHFPNIIDPSVLMSPKVSLGKGNIICANTVLTVDIELGNFNIINLDCTIGHDAVLKDFVTINPSVNVSGNVFVDSCVNIGTGSQIIQGKKIGMGTTIGAGAVVANDLPQKCTAVGVPAKPIKFYEEK